MQQFCVPQRLTELKVLFSSELSPFIIYASILGFYEVDHLQHYRIIYHRNIEKSFTYYHIKNQSKGSESYDCLRLLSGFHLHPLTPLERNHMFKNMCIYIYICGHVFSLWTLVRYDNGGI